MKIQKAIERRLESLEGLPNEKRYKALGSIILDVGLDACQERTDLGRDLRKLRALVIGNGDPENSVMARLGRLETESGKTYKTVNRIRETLLGDLDEGEEPTGIMYRLCELEKLRKDIRRFTWLIVSALAGEVVFTIIRLLGGL